MSYTDGDDSPLTLDERLLLSNMEALAQSDDDTVTLLALEVAMLASHEGE